MYAVDVSHTRRIGCQPERTTLHDGLSRSWSAEQGKENKKRKSGSTPHPHPMLLVIDSIDIIGENIIKITKNETHGAHNKDDKSADGQRGHHVTNLKHACV